MEARVTNPSPAAVRVASTNLIVFVDDAARYDWVVERAARLADKHPCRIVLLDATGATSGVAVDGMRHDVGVAGLAGDAIVSLAAEHTVPGVDAVLWWNGSEFLGSDAFAHLVATVDAVILDSSGRRCGEAVIREVAAFAGRYPGVALHDLAFMRLDPWMDMIAQFFDDPALREDLFSIESLRVESGSEAEAHYLASWLGSRLSWKALDAYSFRAHDGRAIALEREVSGDLRRVKRVVLKAGESTYTAALSEQDPNTVCLTVEGAKAKTTRCAPLRNIDNVSLIERALLKTGTDQIFDTSLVTVRELLT